MDTPSTSAAAALKLEIERLRGAINRHKTSEPAARPPARAVPARPRNNVYVNPNYKPPVKSSKPPSAAAAAPRPASRPPPTAPQEKHDVIIDGVAFESSGRSLVRKDLPKLTPKPPSTSAQPPSRPASHSSFVRNKAGTMMGATRTYKPKTSSRGRALNRNMTLNNTRKQYQSVPPPWLPSHSTFTVEPRSRRLTVKRKYSDKPCPRFTTTGSCNRGLTCLYQHDPSKIAICWPFLQGLCPHTAETCALSHDPTPERTPLCVHFANNGRCNRPNCPFPHVHVGPREGVCRDFAVLGYCEKGLDCDKQHVRECPDFAEKGSCTTKGCKLPHVIRANRNRKAPISTSGPSTDSSSAATPSSAGPEAAVVTDGASSSRQITAEDGQLGDEFISLTFHESESDESGDEDEDEDEDEDDADDDEEDPEPHIEDRHTGDDV